MKFFAIMITLAAASVSCGQALKSTESQVATKAPTIEATARGTLVAVAGIGGESTGYAIESFDGETIEVYFANFMQLATLLDKTVMAKGRIERHRGIEIFERTILVASEVREMKFELCEAYFVGANFIAFTSQCEAGTHSGCSNPFTFSSLDQCEQAASKLNK